MPKKKAKGKGKRKGNPWGDPYAARRKANMSTYMKSLWQTYPRKPSDMQRGILDSTPSLTVSGMGDYRFSKRGKHSIGARAGAWLGDRAQTMLGRITGLGDYSVTQNTVMGLDPPQVVNSSARAVTIRHREYLKDIVTSATPGAFSSESFLLNPGDPHTFPWLAQIAPNFQEYRLDGVLFEFKTMSADALNSTNTALGQVIMATNYNPDAPDFATKYEMENTEFANSVKPSCSMLHPIECARHESILENLYVAPNGIIPVGATDAFYNFCKTQVATNGMQAASVNIGELWITYEITFFKPIVATSLAFLEGHLRVPANALITFTGPFYTPAQGTGTGVIRTFAAANVVSLWTSQHDTPVGSNGSSMVGKTFQVTIVWRDTASTNVTVGGSIPPTVANATILNKFGLDTFGLAAAPLPTTTGPAEQSFIQTFFMVVTAGAILAPVTLTYAAGFTAFPRDATNGPTIDLIVTEVAATL